MERVKKAKKLSLELRQALLRTTCARIAAYPFPYLVNPRAPIQRPRKTTKNSRSPTPRRERAHTSDKLQKTSAPCSVPFCLARIPAPQIEVGERVKSGHKTSAALAERGGGGDFVCKCNSVASSSNPTQCSVRNVPTRGPTAQILLSTVERGSGRSGLTLLLLAVERCPRSGRCRPGATSAATRRCTPSLNCGATYVPNSEMTWTTRVK